MTPSNKIFLILYKLRVDKVLVNEQNIELTPFIKSLMEKSIFFNHPSYK